MLTEIQRQALNQFMFRDRTEEANQYAQSQTIEDTSFLDKEEDISAVDQPNIGDIKVENGITFIYTLQGWVAKDDEEEEDKEIILPDPIPEEQKEKEVDSIVNDKVPPTRNQAYIEIANQTVLRPIDIQISRLENQLDSKYATGEKKDDIRQKLSDLKIEKNQLEKEINTNSYSLITDLSKDTSPYNYIDATDDPVSSNDFLRADTSNIKTLDAYSYDALINKVAIDFFNELGEKAWENATAEDMMYYFRKEVSLDDMIRRATQAGDWSNEQKKRYLWLRETFDNVSFTESRLGRKLEAVGEYTWQIIWDPATTVTLLTAPFTGGTSVAARASTQVASKVAFRHVLLNSLKNNLSPKAIQQVASRIVSKESYTARSL